MVAGGGGGTWFFVGFISWLVVGVVATAVTAIFYYYIEEVRGKVYKGFSSLLAWGHLVFMNVGLSSPGRFPTRGQTLRGPSKVF